jgi:glycosyltransferase involved in cell wall biosynthesis/trans-aconitate methyltransferase
MKISFIEPHLKLFGGIRRIIEFANRLQARGHDVTIFHTDGSPCDWTEVSAKIKSYSDVQNEIHEVLIFNDPNPFDYHLAKAARAKLKVFYVLGLYDTQLLKGSNIRLFLPGNKRMRLLKRSLRSPCLILANATWEKEWLAQNMKIESRLQFGGINTEIFHPVDVPKDPQIMRILTSGDPRRIKGAQTVFKAVEIARKEEPRIVLDCYYGKGLPQNQMARVYSLADVFVDGSRQAGAGWNNPVVEAMACKAPVVCTDIGGVKDFAHHQQTALLVPPDDAHAMASAILRILRDDELAATLRENAYTNIMQFRWDECITGFEEILKKELDSKDIDPSDVRPRDDILSMIPDGAGKILAIGCCVNRWGESIKDKIRAEVTGLELDERSVSNISSKLDKIIAGNICTIDLGDHFPPNYFDCIIFADVLEHVKDHLNILKRTAGFLDQSGVVIASIPNIRHYTTLKNILFKGNRPNQKRGIHDETQLRFFTKKNLRELFQYAGMEITSLQRSYRLIEESHGINHFSKFLAVPPLRDLLTCHYLVAGKKT